MKALIKVEFIHLYIYIYIYILVKQELDFTQRKGPLHGCSFYLDLGDYKDVHILEARLSKLGGVSESDYICMFIYYLLDTDVL